MRRRRLDERAPGDAAGCDRNHVEERDRRDAGKARDHNRLRDLARADPGDEPGAGGKSEEDGDERRVLHVGKSCGRMRGVPSAAKVVRTAPLARNASLTPGSIKAAYSCSGS